MCLPCLYVICYCHMYLCVSFSLFLLAHVILRQAPIPVVHIFHPTSVLVVPCVYLVMSFITVTCTFVSVFLCYMWCQPPCLPCHCVTCSWHMYLCIRFSPLSRVCMSHYVVCRVYLVLTLFVTTTCTFVSVSHTCRKLYSCSVNPFTMTLSLQFSYCHMYLCVSFPYIPSIVFM